MWLILAVAQAADPPAPDLAAIANREGLAAAYEALEALVASAKNDKKRDQALAASKLHTLAVPTKAAFGAELELGALSPMGSCRWEGELRCTLSAQVQAPVTDGDFEVVCQSKYGAKARVPSTLSQADGVATWTVTQVGDCWALTAVTVVVRPTSHDDLEGVGAGDDDLIPPELTGLTKEQVDAEIDRHMGSFKACTTGEGQRATGQLVVAYEIGEDGAMAKVTAQTAALNSPDAEACILERMGRLTFPPPNEGYTSGTTTFHFQ